MSGQYELISEYLVDHGFIKDTFDSGPGSLTDLPSPSGEFFSRVSDDYPLAKHTSGFYGDKHFDIQIAANEKPHVVFLFLESFRAADVGVLGGNHPSSPRFNALSKSGILFSNFYANGVQTSRGVVASLFGILPRFTRHSVQNSDSDIRLIGIPDLFHQKGYLTAFFHNGSLLFENKISFFPQHGFQKNYGRKDIKRTFPNASGYSWGIHDEYLIQYFVDWLEKNDAQGQPTFSALFTVSNHHPWKTPPGFSSPEFNVSNNDEYSQFLRSFHYTDYCLGLFMDMLNKRGLDKNTIIFVLADTSAPMGEHGNNFLLTRNLYEENVRIPLLILANERLEHGIVIDEIGSQVDLLPTVMDIFGFQGINHSIGTSLVRKIKNRAVFFNNPFSEGYLGMRKGKYKVIYTAGKNSVSLYDLAGDPHESNSIANSHNNLADEMMQNIKQKHRLFRDLYKSRKFCLPSNFQFLSPVNSNNHSRIIMGHEIVAHAGGMINDFTYTNSKESLNHNYDKGFRYFELDFNWTQDGKLVLIHDWKRTYQGLYPHAGGIPTLSEFERLRMHENLTPLTIDDFIQWMNIHQDAFVITDTKTDTLAALLVIKKRGGRGLMNRVIPQIYNFAEYQAVAELGYLDIILTLYRMNASDDEIINFCERHHLFGVTISEQRIKESNLAMRLHDLGIFVYAHTVNCLQMYENLKKLGVDGIYTDFLISSSDAQVMK